jgi:hypothetical protein
LSALITVGKFEFVKNFFASSILVKIPNLAVGILYSSHSFFVNILEPF